MVLYDLVPSRDVLQDTDQLTDAMGLTVGEILAEALEMGWNREISSEDDLWPLRVKFEDDRARMRYGVELLVEQLRNVEAEADPS